MRLVDDAERRARLARRHALAPSYQVEMVEDATNAVVVLHATEAASVYLSLQARVPGVTLSEIDRALYDDRSLVKQLAMRRTLFVFPTDLLPAAWGSASARVAGVEQRKLAKNLADAGLTDDGVAWLENVAEEIRSALAERGALSALDVRAAIASIDVKVSSAPGAKWGGEPMQIAPRILTWLGARGEIVRGNNGGQWRTSKPLWTRMADWVDRVPPALGERAGYAELVRRWLYAFGPGTEEDLVWWLGSTKSAVRNALAEVNAVEVGLESGLGGWLLPDDTAPEPPVESWAALLPVLDPTTMGWKHRGFYLDPADTPYLFDTNGNAGTTAWWDGRIVGCWVQDEDGTVRVVLRRDPGPDARGALDAEAQRLTEWLDGVVISSVYKSPLMKGAVLR